MEYEKQIAMYNLELSVSANFGTVLVLELVELHQEAVQSTAI